jgi:hypothetical protein
LATSPITSPISTLAQLIETAVPEVIRTAKQISFALQTLEDPFHLRAHHKV